MRLKTTLLIILIVFMTAATTFFLGLYFTPDSLKIAIVIFLLLGAAAAVFLSRITARLFEKIGSQNRALEKLSETVSARDAVYSRDLREREKMLSEIEHRDNLLDTSNRVSFVLFDTAEDENIEAVLTDSLKLLGECADTEQVYIAQNEMVDGVLHFTCKYAWDDGSEGGKKAMLPGMMFPYGLDYDWDSRFTQGQCMNGPISGFPPAIREFFARFAVKSVLVIPVFVQERFWGLVGFSDCTDERFFVDDEVKILRSMGLMMAAAADRRIQAAAIREADNRTRILTNATPIGFNLWNRNFENVETNDTAVRLFGLKGHREYLDMFFDLSPEYQPDGSPSREKAEKLLSEAFETGYHQFEWMHQKPDGTELPMEITLVRVDYEDDYAVAGYMRDLREYKKMTAESDRMINEIEQRDYLLQIVNKAIDKLLRSEPDDFSNTLTHCMGMMAGAISADRMFLDKNSVEDGELYHTRLHEWADETLTLPDETPMCGISYDAGTLAIKEALMRGEYVNSVVRDMAPADREKLEMRGVRSVMLLPIFIRGEFWGNVGFDNCRSERLFTENEVTVMRSGGLLIASALLRNQYMTGIRDASAKLEIALEEARHANRAKSDFLANVSHEMRTPLNAIIGLSEIILDDGRTDEDTKASLEKIFNSGSTLLSIVNDLLDISKVQAGKFVILENQYDVPGMVNDAILQNVLRIGSKPVRFILDIDENIPAYLYGDELRVKQIINNLLSNAFKYTKEGAVQFRLTCERDEDDAVLTIRVRDTGIGIRPELLKRLFTDYTQLGDTTYQQAGGTGLGLTITKSLVEMMGGGITVESRYGEGSAFTATLRQRYVSDAVIGPKVAESLKRFQYSASKLKQNSRLNRVKLPYARVLVVDDNITNLDVARGFMKPYGMQTDCVTSGKDAVRAIRDEKVRYNAVFMDHMMPEMDGIEAVRRIREEIGTEYARTIPIIALTANAVSGSEEMFLKNGFQGFISKPIDLTGLDEAIMRFVRDKAQEALFGESPGGAEDKGEAEYAEADSLLENININGVDKQKALDSFNGDASVFLDVLRSYATNTRPILTILREYLASGNFTDYTIAVHGIKGASYSISAWEAGKAAEALEAAAKAGAFDAVRAMHADFEKLAETLLDDIDRALGEAAAAGKAGDVRDGSDKDKEKEKEKEYLDFIAPEAEILIVDDNETNLKAAVGLMKPLKMRTDTAENGEKALEMMMKKRYHLVFMDHLMPITDGIEAVVKLRRMDGEYYRKVPVIALTANDSGEAGERFIQAGMNDVVTKPIEIREICAKLKKWLPGELLQKREPQDGREEASNYPPDKRNGASNYPPGKRNEASSCPPDRWNEASNYPPDKRNGTPNCPRADGQDVMPSIEGIDTDEGIRYCGGKELFISLLGDFYKLIDLKAAKIEKCLGDGLLRDVTIEVHALKNTARMIGAKELSEGFYRLERYGNEEDREALERETPAVLARYRGLKAVLKPFGEAAEEEKREADSGELVSLLRELKSAMDGFDLDGADEAMKRLEELRTPAECRAHMEELRAYVADVAMEEVMRLTDVMIKIIEKAK